MTIRYRYWLRCAFCDKHSEITMDEDTTLPRVNCGDCLWNDSAIRPMKVLRCVAENQLEMWDDAS